MVENEESLQRLERWETNWKDGVTGWHLEDVNPQLIKHGHHILNIDNNDETKTTKEKNGGVRVLFPLCGKTVDMAYLASSSKGEISRVVGVDGVAKALAEFALEHPELGMKRTVDNDSSNGMLRFDGDRITLYQADFFNLGKNNDKQEEEPLGGRFDAVFDRGSLVAIPPELRQDYVGVLKSLLKQGGKILLEVMERRSGTAEAVSRGPPHSFTAKDVKELFSSQEDWVESVTLLEEADFFEKYPKDIGAKPWEGLTEFMTLVLLIQAK